MARFIKFIPDERVSIWLAQKYPYAFALLMIIAERARRYEGGIDGHQIGYAHIGDWEKWGWTEGQYRQALKILISYKFVEKIETNRNPKNATTGTTTKGTLVKLLDSRVWDINPEINNDSNNESTTNQQRLNNDEQEPEEPKEGKEMNQEPPTPKGGGSGDWFLNQKDRLVRIGLSAPDSDFIILNYHPIFIEEAIQAIKPGFIPNKGFMAYIRGICERCKKETPSNEEIQNHKDNLSTFYSCKRQYFEELQPLYVSGHFISNRENGKEISLRSMKSTSFLPALFRLVGMEIEMEAEVLDV